MSRLNTMNLSMELLKNWRYGFNNATTTKPEYDPHHQVISSPLEQLHFVEGIFWGVVVDE